MKQEVRTAFAVATAANAAAQFARTAENLARVNPSELKLVDQAFWLCRTAASKAEAAADALDPEWADLDETVTYAHATANGAAQLANEAADDLVSLAEANNHSIRR